jgi:hypothetical protein
MKNSIVADGPLRFSTSEEYQARRRELQQTVVARYAAQLAEAGFLRGLFIRYLRESPTVIFSIAGFRGW